MDPKLVRSISAQIYARFPEVTGVQPKVRLQPVPKGTTRSVSRMYLLTFHVRVSGPAGKTIPRWVRVTSDAQGHILKTTTSHS